MGQNPPASHNQIQVQHVDQRLSGPLLVKDIRDGALLLDALESSGEGLVMAERQAQGFARDRLLDHQFLEGLGNCGRPDHFVLDAVAQVLFIDRERHPPHDVLKTAFGQHVGDAVTHAEVGRYRAVKDALKDREDVGGRPSDIHPD